MSSFCPTYLVVISPSNHHVPIKMFHSLPVFSAD